MIVVKDITGEELLSREIPAFNGNGVTTNEAMRNAFLDALSKLGDYVESQETKGNPAIDSGLVISVEGAIQVSETVVFEDMSCGAVFRKTGD